MGWTYLRFNGPLDYRHIRSINLSKERLAVSIDLTNQCRSRSLSLIMSKYTTSNIVCQGNSVSFSLFFSCVVNMSLLYINSCQLANFAIIKTNTIKTTNPIPNHKNNLQTNLKHVFILSLHTQYTLESRTCQGLFSEFMKYFWEIELCN